MGFTDPQIRKLKASLRREHVKMREAEGLTLHYLEGWHVVAEANRIFGFDGWDREILANSCVWTKQMGARYCAAYVAKVRITVRAGDAIIIREGSGAGESNEPTPGQAHDRAAKAAETDATKRALTTFGNCFGLKLYAGGMAQGPQFARQRADDQKTNGMVVPQLGIAGNGGTPAATVGREGAQALEHPHGSNGGEQDEAAGAIDSEIGTKPAPAGTIGLSQGRGSPQGLAQLPDKLPTSPDAKQDPDNLTSDRLFPPSGDTPGPIAQSNERPSVDKSALAIAEPRRVRDPEHLKYVAEQPCMICGREPCEAHHLRYVQPRAMGRKSSDTYAVPLCALHHRELHARGNERAWWVAKGFDPLTVADQLWRETSNKRAKQPQPDSVFG